MRIAVTGGSGFLGSYLVEDLIARGHEVAVVVRPQTDRWRLQDVLGRIRLLEGSLDDIAGLRRPLELFQPEVVVHLAWRGVGNTDRNSPAQARNIVDAVELASLCAEIGVKAFVGAGSQAEYGPYQRAIREEDVARPTTLYGKAKLAACGMTEQIATSGWMRFAWLRIFSTYGPKDADFWIIPDLIRTLRSGKRMPLTAGEQLWGFLHARDAAAGFRTVIESKGAQGIYNLGASDAPRLRDTVTALREMVNPAAELGFGDVPYRPDQVKVLKADISRLTALGWEPRIDLPSGLKETVAWYVQHS
ncbi:MAG: NAD(P)-dependent oxidoreductase [Xanthobacteraceae bacterium]|nr:NAD(P)-dependent oxidoreductase [Xanthobacteraceae bacterium]